MSAWSSGSQALTMAMLLLLIFTLPTVLYAAPVADQQHADLETYYPVADATGCYYNFQHYDEGDRIITNEPCLNCTCHNRMLMCYLRVCPFIKAIGEDCKVEKRADQCCPVITCPEVPVQLLTSSTTPATAAVGHLDSYGCSIERLFYADGARVPSDPNNPCELCYCIRNRTACVMQECTLHIQGCAPIYHEGVCCPVRYDCDHPELTSAVPAVTTTTPEPTTTGLIFTTTLAPGASSECVFDGEVFADGALVKKDVACEHCYCMKGDIVCAVQECAPTPLDKVNCKAQPPTEGKCCPDTYVCDNVLQEELTTAIYEFTTVATTIAPVEENIIPEHDEHTLPPVTPTEAIETVRKEGEESATDIARPQEDHKPDSFVTEVPSEVPVKGEADKEQDVLETPVDEVEDEVEDVTEEVEHPVTGKEEELPVTEKEEIVPVTEEEPFVVTKEDHAVTESEKLPEEEKKLVTEAEQLPVTEEEQEEHPITQEVGQPVTESVQEEVTEEIEEQEQPVSEKEKKPVPETEEHPVIDKEQQPAITETEERPVTEKEEELVTEHHLVTEEEQPVTEAEQFSVTEELQQPITEKLHPATEEERAQAATEKQKPVTEKEPQLVTATDEQAVTEEEQHPVTEEEQYQVTDEDQSVLVDKEGPPARIPGEDITEEAVGSTTEVSLPEVPEVSTKAVVDSRKDTVQPTEEPVTGKTVEDETTRYKFVEESATTVKSVEEVTTTKLAEEPITVTVKDEEPLVHVTSTERISQVTEELPAHIPSEEQEIGTQEPVSVTEQEVGEIITVTPEAPKEIQPDEQVTEVLQPEVITLHEEAGEPIETHRPSAETEKTVVTSEESVTDVTEGVPYVPEHVAPTEIPRKEQVTEEVSPVTESVQHVTEIEPMERVTDTPAPSTYASVTEHEVSVTEGEEPQSVTEGEVMVTEKEHVPDEEHPSSETEQTPIEVSSETLPIESDLHTEGVVEHITDTHVETSPKSVEEHPATLPVEGPEEEVALDETTQGPELEAIPSATEQEPIQPQVEEEEEEAQTVAVLEHEETTPYSVKEQPSTTLAPEQLAEEETTSYIHPVATTEVVKADADHTPLTPTDKAVEPVTESKEESVTEEIGDIVHEPTEGEAEIELTTPEPVELHTPKHVQPTEEEVTTAAVPEEIVAVTVPSQQPEHVETEAPELVVPEASSVPTEEEVIHAVVTTTEAFIEKEAEPAERTTVSADVVAVSEESTEKLYPEEEQEQQAPSERPEATTLSVEEEVEEFTTAFPVREHAIPGEGSCLVDGQTYSNNTAVPPINHCQLSCKCISSILQCENVICSPAPSNLQNCMPVYQGPESCCPTYSCTVPGSQEVESDSHKMEEETVPPVEITSPGIPVEELEAGVDTTTSTPVGDEKPETATIPETPDKVEEKPTEAQPVEEVSEVLREPVTEEEPSPVEELPAEVSTEMVKPEPTEAVHVPSDKEVEQQTESARPEVETPAPTESAATELPETEVHIPAEHDETVQPEEEVSEVTTIGVIPIEDKETSKEATESSTEAAAEAASVPACPEGADCAPQEYIPVPIVPCADGQPCEPTSSEIPVVVIPSQPAPAECKEEEGCVAQAPAETSEEECKESDCAPSVTEETIPVAHVPQCEGEACKYPGAPSVVDAEVEKETEEEPILTTAQPLVKDTEVIEEATTTVKTLEEETTIRRVEEQEHTTRVLVEEPSEGTTVKTSAPSEVAEEVTTSKPEVAESVKTEPPAEEQTSEEPLQEVITSKVEEPVEDVTLFKVEEPITALPEEPIETVTKELAIEEATTQISEVFTEGRPIQETTVHAEPEEESPKGTLPTAPFDETYKPEEVTTEAKEIVHVDEVPESTSKPIESDEHVLEDKVTTQVPIESTEAPIKSVEEEQTPIVEYAQTTFTPEQPVKETESPIHEGSEVPAIQVTEISTHKGTETSVSEGEITTLAAEYEEPETVTKVKVPGLLPEAVPEAVTEQEIKPIEEEPAVVPTTEYSHVEPEEETEKHYEVTPSTGAKAEAGEESTERPVTEHETEPEDIQSEDVTAEDTDASPRPIPGEDRRTSVEPETSSEEYITETAKPTTGEEEVVTEEEPVVPHKEVEAETERIPDKEEDEEKIKAAETTPVPDYFTTTTIQELLTQSTPLPVISTTIMPSHELPDHRPEIPDYQVPGAEEEEYDEEEQSFGPGTCRYGGKVYVSAQQIPRDDPCDFCFCFRSDIICLQQSCPPPIPRCHEEPIRGFCCPRYECPVSMATSVNITTTTTTTTTTLPPHFSAHAYKGRASRTGCLIQDHSYKVGETIRSASGPCLHCVCGGDGQMKCDPKVCSPEPMLRQMIAAAAAKRRR